MRIDFISMSVTTFIQRRFHFGQLPFLTFLVACLLCAIIYLQLQRVKQQHQTINQRVDFLRHREDSAFEKTQDFIKRNQEHYKMVIYEEKFCPHNGSCDLIKPFIHYESRQMLAPSYGVSACVIYKNFSTVLTSIICYLYDILRYQEKVKEMMKDTYNHRLCMKDNEYHSFNIRDRMTPKTAEKWTNYLIVREPLERFISGFVNKCILDVVNRDKPCYGCDENITCVMEKQYQSLKTMSNNNKAARKHTVEDAHFGPQSWHCELRAHYLDYKILQYSPAKTEELLEELLTDFEEFGVPLSVTDDIREQVLGGKTFHATFDTPERIHYTKVVEESPYLKELLVKMFYYDYVFFDFPLPVLEIDKTSDS
ncbi:unnamed protein product, partial [Mesorhabditis belari]|uniref:Carbohydrate sulfotransferase n=1 Tax=Mesorhabditis belari TaxID=2138241 RepID=A0AAF3J5T2_9BILA